MAKDISLVKDIEDITHYVFDLEQTLKDRIAVIRHDVNKLMKEYLDRMFQMKLDHEIIQSYLTQNKDFQKWTAKQALKTR